MNARQILKYAQENGFNSVKFSFKTRDGASAVGEFWDAYFEFVKIPVLGDGFITMGQLEDQLGYDVEFEIVPEDEYQTRVWLDFVLRGQKVPKEYQIIEVARTT